jgi:hypothetical protein
MRFVAVILTVLLVNTAAARGTDRGTDMAKAKTIELQMVRLTQIVNDYSEMIATAADYDSIHFYAAIIEKEAGTLLNEIRAAYKINDDCLSGYITNLALAGAFQKTNPGLSTTYQAMAAISLIDGFSQDVPAGYELVRNVKRLAEHIGYRRKASAIQRLNKEMNEYSQQILALDKIAGN